MKTQSADRFKNIDSAGNQRSTADLLNDYIAELQTLTTQNAALIKALELALDVLGSPLTYARGSETRQAIIAIEQALADAKGGKR